MVQTSLPRPCFDSPSTLRTVQAIRTATVPRMTLSSSANSCAALKNCLKMIRATTITAVVVPRVIDNVLYMAVLSLTGALHAVRVVFFVTINVLVVSK